MQFSHSDLRDVILIDPVVHEDARGFFTETWHAGKFADAGIDATFVQDNHTRSEKGSLRGLHYQIEQAQGKLIRVSRGEAFDVAVDLRKSSPTFGQWTGTTLSAQNRRSIWIPAGFAHGFFVTGDCAEFVYRCTDYYSPEHERTIRWDDPDIGVQWPLGGKAPVVSEKDAAGTAFKDAEVYA